MALAGRTLKNDDATTVGNGLVMDPLGTPDADVAVTKIMFGLAGSNDGLADSTTPFPVEIFDVTGTMAANIVTLAGAVSESEMQVDIVASLPAGTNEIGKLAAGTAVIGGITIASAAVASGAFASGSIASGAVSSGAVASGAFASGALASGSVASGAFAAGSIAVGAITAGATGLVHPIDTAVGGTDYGVAMLLKHAAASSRLTTATDDYDIPRMSEFGAILTEPEQHLVIDDMNNLLGFGGTWAAINDDTTGVASSTKHVLGSASVEFDKVAGSSDSQIGGITKTLTAIDLSGASPHDILQMVTYVGSTGELDDGDSYVFLRLGASSTNYNEWRIDSSLLTAGIWETVAFEIGDASFAGQGGTGIDWSAIAYIAAGFFFDDIDDTLANSYIDEISFHTNQHVNAAINAEITSTINSANVNINKVGNKVVNTQAGTVGTGTQRFTLASNDPAVVALQIIDDWDETNRAAVNLIASQVGVAGGTGTDGATVLRVSMATDIALPAGTNEIGKIAAGTAEMGFVKLASGNVASGAIASGAVASGAIASGAVASGAFASGSIASGAIVAGAIDAGATSFVKLDDVAYAANDAGVPMLAVREDEQAAMTPASGDYTPVRCDKFGNMKVSQLPDATSIVKFASISASTNGDNTLVAAAGVGIKIRVLSYVLVADGAVGASFEDGAGGTALSANMPFAANGGISCGYNPAGWFETSDNVLLNLELDGTPNVFGHLSYVEV